MPLAPVNGTSLYYEVEGSGSPLVLVHGFAGGLSMGGNIALNFALAYPQMVGALIIADTGAGSDGTAEWTAHAHAYATILEQRGMEAFADAEFENPLFARYVAQGPHAARFIR